MENLTDFQRQLIMHLNLLPAIKKGRCFNGYEKDKGKIVHLVPALSEGDYGDWFTKAICGSEPGLRGNGWSKSEKEINCKKCLKVLDKNK